MLLTAVTMFAVTHLAAKSQEEKDRNAVRDGTADKKTTDRVADQAKNVKDWLDKGGKK